MAFYRHYLVSFCVLLTLSIMIIWRWHWLKLNEVEEMLNNCQSQRLGKERNEYVRLLKSQLVPNSKKPQIDFPLTVPKDQMRCEDVHLFWGLDVTYDDKYYNDLLSFQAQFEKMYQKYLRPVFRNVEGHTGQNPPSVMLLRAAVAKPWIKTVCEVGFNAGHSTFNWLTANRNARVYSFDLNFHNYSKPMAAYLSERFPGRLHVTWGASEETIPLFIKNHPDIKCDLMMVDGGHYYYYAKNDLNNFRKMANKRNIVAFDDYPTEWGKSFGRAWEEMRTNGTLNETFRCECHFRDINKVVFSERGLTFGTYVLP